MSKIPTAEGFQKKYLIEYYDEGGYQGIDEKEVSKMLIEFAKLHVEEALLAAEEEVDGSLSYVYPLENIK